MREELEIIDMIKFVRGRALGEVPPWIKIKGTCAIDNYVPNKVSFVKNQKYEPVLSGLKNAVVLIPESMTHVQEEYPQNIYIVVKDISNSLIDLQNFFYEDEESVRGTGISASAKIAPTANIGKRVFIDENVCIGENVVIGDDTRILANSVIMDRVSIGEGGLLYPGVTVYRKCTIGKQVILHSGARLGLDLFRYAPDNRRGTVRKMIEVGKVTIGDRVEIGANSVVCRATFEDSSTLIANDVKVADLVAIAHNVTIGSRTIIAAQTCICGSTRIGEDVWIGVGVSISNGLAIGDRAKLLINAVVTRNVADDEILSGFYAMPHRQWKQVNQSFQGM